MKKYNKDINPKNYYGLVIEYADHYDDEDRKRCQKQRKKRGFDDTELYTLDFTIISFAYPRMKRLKKIGIGHPNNLTEKEWEKCLGDMVFWMKHYLKDEGILFNSFSLKKHPKILNKKERRLAKRYLRGKKYFFKHFESLWS